MDLAKFVRHANLLPDKLRHMMTQERGNFVIWNVRIRNVIQKLYWSTATVVTTRGVIDSGCMLKHGQKITLMEMEEQKRFLKMCFQRREQQKLQNKQCPVFGNAFVRLSAY